MPRQLCGRHLAREQLLEPVAEFMGPERPRRRRCSRIEWNPI